MKTWILPVTRRGLSGIIWWGSLRFRITGSFYIGALRGCSKTWLITCGYCCQHDILWKRTQRQSQTSWRIIPPHPVYLYRYDNGDLPSYHHTYSFKGKNKECYQGRKLYVLSKKKDFSPITLKLHCLLATSTYLLHTTHNQFLFLRFYAFMTLSPTKFLTKWHLKI